MLEGDRKAGLICSVRPQALTWLVGEPSMNVTLLDAGSVEPGGPYDAYITDLIVPPNESVYQHGNQQLQPPN